MSKPSFRSTCGRMLVPSSIPLWMNHASVAPKASQLRRTAPGAIRRPCQCGEEDDGSRGIVTHLRCACRPGLQAASAVSVPGIAERMRRQVKELTFKHDDEACLPGITIRDVRTQQRTARERAARIANLFLASASILANLAAA